MLLRRRGLTGQRYDLVGVEGTLARIRLRPMRQAATIVTGDGSGWRVDRDPGFGAWRTRPLDSADPPLVTVAKGFARERYEMDFEGGHLVLARRMGARRRIDVIDGRDVTVGEIALATLWSGTYHLHVPPLPDAVTATVAFLVVLLNRRDNAASWS